MIIIPGASGYTFGFQRTLSYMPFFLIGYLVPKNTMDKLTEHKSILTSAFSVLILYLGFKISSFEGVEALYRGSYGFSSIYMGESISRIEMLIVSYLFVPVISMAVFILIPKDRTLFTKFGINSMGIFLFHAIVIIFVSVYFRKNIVELNSVVQLFIWVVLSVITCCVFGSDWFNRLIKKLKII